MTKNNSSDRPSSKKNLTLFALASSAFATQPASIITGLLLIDIGNTFNSPVGVTSQIRTLSPFIAFIVGLLMGGISLRFRHKSLLIEGLFCIGVSALLCGLAPDFTIMLISYSLNGLGAAMVVPMTMTLVGAYFPLDNRAGAISWIVSAQAMAYFICTPIIGYLATLGGWRWTFFGFVLPISFLCLVLASFCLPNESKSRNQSASLKTIFTGFKGVLSNTSANSCLLGNVLSMACWTAILLYSASFNRQRFGVSMEVATIILLGGSASYTAGSLLSGRLVKGFGRKPVTFFSAFFAGIFTLAYTNLSLLWLCVVAAYIGCFFAGARTTAANSLTLEQVPAFRGTMMSLNSAASSLGSSLGAGIGGLALLIYGYEGMAMALGALGVIAGLIYSFKTIDPTKVLHA